MTRMTVALFVPCYIDQLYPDVAIATLQLLEQLGVDIVYPKGQTCCGQPMANVGCTSDTAPVAHRFVKLFSDFDAVVCPSASCTAMVRQHYGSYFDSDDQQYKKVSQNTFELCEYLHDVLQLKSLDTSFPHRVSLHQSCHGLRELRLAGSTELMETRVDKVREVLGLVSGIEFKSVTRQDECCGFGGMFSVTESDVSALMGRDRIADHLNSESEVIVSTDMSCLMHLEGLIRRNDNPVKIMHVAQVLAGRQLL